MNALDKVISQGKHPEHLVRAVWWSYSFWKYLKAVFWLPLVFPIVCFFEIKEIFF